MKQNTNRTSRRITVIGISFVVALGLLLGLGQPANAATHENRNQGGATAAVAVAQGVSTVRTHEWSYDGVFPDPWSCEFWGNFGIDQGWWSAWMCVKSGLFGPWILWVKPYH